VQDGGAQVAAELQESAPGLARLAVPRTACLCPAHRRRTGAGRRRCGYRCAHAWPRRIRSAVRAVVVPLGRPCRRRMRSEVSPLCLRCSAVSEASICQCAAPYEGLLGADGRSEQMTGSTRAIGRDRSINIRDERSDLSATVHDRPSMYRRGVTSPPERREQVDSWCCEDASGNGRISCGGRSSSPLM
jgi:hypothetical protein